MTILNFQQNNYRNTLNLHGSTPQQASQSERKTALLLQLVTSWMEHLLRRHQQGGDLITSLQQSTPAGPVHEQLAELEHLHGESTSGLQTLTALLRGEVQHTLGQLPPPSGAGHAWIWYSLQLFFEQWNPETADYHLWLLSRPVLLSQGEAAAKEREETASFYELAKLLITAAHALHQERTTLLPAS